MIRRLYATDDSLATAILRLTLGAVFFVHGAQKMLGWFGGFGFRGTMGFFTDLMHVPAPLPSWRLQPSSSAALGSSLDS